ncbi:MAG: DIP1984 family protein [Nocardioidaceae bacterium]
MNRVGCQPPLGSAVDVRATRREADEIARELRELDTRIQEINWATELLE